MTAILRDSTNPANIPVGTTDVGGYVDGLYGLGTNYWNAAAWARWEATGARLRRIAAVTVDTPSNTADCERFDLGAADIPIWWQNMRALGEVDLWAYCSRDQQHAVEDDCWAANIPLDQLSMWIATLDGTQVVAQYRYPIAAVQYIDKGPYDESVVYETFGGGGGIITAQARRTTILANGSLQQFLRGTDNALYHRRCSKGAWSAWAKLGGTLTADAISGGVDDQGTLRVTVVGVGGLYDISSADDGLTFGPFSGPNGSGTGLITISGYGGVAEVSPPKTVAGTWTGTIS